MNQRKLLGVQYLRAVAALMVVYFHLIMWAPAYTDYLRFSHWIKTDYFPGAVPVFFVISGFVMYVSGINSVPGRFAWKRLARIVPLYWIVTLIAALLSAKHGGVPPLASVAKSLLFIPYWTHPGESIAYPIVMPGWSLNFEMFFYGLFTLALFLPVRWRLMSLLTTLSALVGLGALYPTVTASPMGLTYTSSLLLLFAGGIVTGWSYRKGFLHWHPALSLLTLSLGFVCLIGSGVPSSLRHGIAPLLIVVSTVSLDSCALIPDWRPMRMMGDASYSIYLVHFLVLDLVWKYWQHLHALGAVAAVAFAITCVAATIGLALLTYRLIERPAMKWTPKVPYLPA